VKNQKPGGGLKEKTVLVGVQQDRGKEGQTQDNYANGCGSFTNKNGGNRGKTSWRMKNAQLRKKKNRLSERWK